MIARLPQSWQRGVGWDVLVVWAGGYVAESELGVGWGVGRGCAGGVLVVWAGEAEALSVAAF